MEENEHKQTAWSGPWTKGNSWSIYWL